MLLVTFDRDWADEFSPFGMALMTRDQYETMILWATNANWMFGSNEGFEDEDITDGFTVQELGVDEELILERTIFKNAYAYNGYKSVGLFPSYEFPLEDDEIEG